jgi:hypothetical protein
MVRHVIEDLRRRQAVVLDHQLDIAHPPSPRWPLLLGLPTRSAETSVQRSSQRLIQNELFGIVVPGPTMESANRKVFA